MADGIKLKDKIKLWIFIAVMFFSLFLLVYEERANSLNPKHIKQYILHFGIWAPVIFLFIYSLKSFVIFIPAGIFMLAAGLSFGTMLGAIILTIGTILSSTIGFVFARYFGRDYVQKRLSNTRMGNISGRIAQKGFLIILLLRLVPILPYDAINYICGMSKIKYKDFILATIIGTIPACILYAYLGENLLKPFTKGFYLSIFLVILISLAPFLFAKNIKEFLGSKGISDNETDRSDKNNKMD